jgi:hypothetical protein
MTGGQVRAGFTGTAQRHHAPGHRERAMSAGRERRNCAGSVLQHGLILQRHISDRSREPTLIVAAAGLGLAFPAPAGPVQAMGRLLVAEEQQGEQSPHFRHGERD